MIAYNEVFNLNVIIYATSGWIRCEVRSYKVLIEFLVLYFTGIEGLLQN
jgi:hypothetical protein